MQEIGFIQDTRKQLQDWSDDVIFIFLFLVFNQLQTNRNQV